jgi:hypothetical protein
MCHLATFRHGCGHWTLFQLHCDRGQDQLCDKGQTEVIARYRTGLQCLDCFDREWYVEPSIIVPDISMPPYPPFSCPWR